MKARSRSRTKQPRRNLLWLALALVFSLVLAACGGDDFGVESYDDASESAPPEMASPSVGLDAERSVVDMDGGGIDPIPPITPGSPTGRHVVRSAEVVIETGDTTRALDDVIAIAERAGGYAATIDVSRGSEGTVSGWVTLRVPTDRLNGVVADIEAVGDVVPRSRIDEYDVTFEYVDIQARLSNLKAFEQELLALLAEVRESTPEPESLLEIFNRIREVRAEIDQLEAREIALSDQISMATVHVGIEQRRSAAEVSWGPGSTMRDAFAATVRLLTSVADGIIWAIVTVLPIAFAVLVLPALITWIFIRRRRRGQSNDDQLEGLAE